MKIITGYCNTKLNCEDLELTPYIFLVNVKAFRIYGLGICWLHQSFYVALGFNMPKKYNGFIKFFNHNNFDGFK